MSFETQSTHEIRSIKLKLLLKNSSKLVHLTSIPVTLANYRIDAGWFSSSVGQRFPDLEPCSVFETLSAHLRINPAEVKDFDELAVNASDLRAIKHALATE